MIKYPKFNDLSSFPNYIANTDNINDLYEPVSDFTKLEILILLCLMVIVNFIFFYTRV